METVFTFSGIEAAPGKRARGQTGGARTGRPRLGLAVTVLAAIAAAFVIAGSFWQSGIAAPESAPAARAAPAVGVFTGEYADGLPVYRLPSVRVVARRGGAGGRAR
jgi:hypothetical protein